LTRIAALADLHANLPALDAIIAEIAPLDLDAVVVAGDLINMGPFSTEVLERVFSLGWAAVRGNHEFYLLDYKTPRAPAHWRDYTTPRWLNETIPLAYKRRLAAMPDTLALTFPDAPPLRVYHGYPHTPWDSMYPSNTDAEAIDAFRVTQEETILVGHVHLQQERWLREGDCAWHIINPGSAGLTLDRQVNTAPYALLEGDSDGWRATFCRASFDPQPLRDAFARPDYVHAHGAYARLYAAEFEHAHVYIWPFNRWRADACPGEPVTHALVDQFLALGEDVLKWVPEDFASPTPIPASDP
jgi:predicted phosphodiesterase